MIHATRWLSLLFLSLGLCLTAEVHAQVPEEAKEQIDGDDPDKFKLKQVKSNQESSFERQPPHPSRSFFDLHNGNVTLDRTGQYAFADPFSGSNGSFPRATSGNTTFAQGLMFAGKVKDGLGTEIRSGGGTYFSGMKPGGLLEGGVPEDRSNSERFHVWRVHRNWEDPSVQRSSAAYREGIANPANVGQSAVSTTREQYEYDWNNWPAADGAPFQDCNNNGTYEPAPPEEVGSATDCEALNDAGVDGDIPGRKGADQTLWTVSNDIGSASLGTDNSFIYASPEIGVEVQYTVWGYDRPPGSPLGNIAFHNAKLIYKGKPSAADVEAAGSPDYLSADAHPAPTPDDAVIDSMFISWWVDPDVGTFSNDFVGVDTSSALGFAYNAGPNDATFESLGLPPAAVGFDMLKGPTLDPATNRRPTTAAGDTLGLSSFAFFASGTRATDPALFEYTGTLEWFNLMRGVLPQPAYPASEPFINPITGQPSQFTNSGDPVTGDGWNDGVFIGPSDRRMNSNSGPFRMEVGDTVDVTMAQVKGVGTGYLSSISIVRFYDQAAQFTFDQDFEIPTPPRAPAATANGGDEKVILSWGGNESRIREVEEQYSAPPGYEFEAYRVYQLPSRGAALSQGERIETFDVLNNGVRQLRNNVFNEESGVVEEQTVQVLGNTGIKRSLVIDRDAIKQAPIRNGNDYYFAVTSVGYLSQSGANVPNRVLESSPARFTVRPQAPAPGVENLPEVGQSLSTDYSGKNGQSRPATAPSVEVLLPDSVRTEDYTITTGSSWGVQRGGTQIVDGVDFGDSRVVDGLLVSVEDTASAGSGLDPNNDSWSFSAEGATEASEEQLSEEVKKIGVFPNPYRGFNELEDSRFDKFVRFTNLPSPEKGTTTIRIFTLSGNPVKVIRHDSDSPNPNFEDWDLKNESDTWVSSGVYLVHVSTPFGDKELRLALVMEEEILRNY